MLEGLIYTEKTPMKLLLADDHTLFRDAIIQFIQRAEPDAEIHIARDIHGVMDILESQNGFDLVLLDLRMPGMDGMEGLKKLRASFSAVPVALLSGVAEEDDVKKAVNLGARGYFPKTLSGRALLRGIHAIIDGGEYIALDDNSDNIMPSHYPKGAPSRATTPNADIRDKARHARLTPRELEVLHFLVQGASNKEIARELELQLVTVKLHVRGICRKLNAKNRTQAALTAREWGLTS